MPPDFRHLDLREQARVGAAFEGDPALEAEVKAILALLDPAARRCFVSAFAAALSEVERPGAAVMSGFEAVAKRARRGGDG